MTDEQLALARRAVACKHWRPLPGMRSPAIDSSDVSVRAVFEEDGRLWCVSEVPDSVEEDGARSLFAWEDGWLPDLGDALTALGLLHLARKAWGEPVHVAQETPRIPMGLDPDPMGDDGKWRVWFRTSHPDSHSARFVGNTEAEALIAALEDAP